MGDMIDLFRDLKALNRAERKMAWDQKEDAFRQIREQTGFEPLVMSDESRHVRIKVPGSGWFDYWPSSGRWSQSPRPGGRKAKRGFQLDSLIAALQIEPRL